MKSTNYWFPAKKYGWGWGPPNCWQGWTVIVTWVLCQIVGAILLAREIPVYIVYAFALSAGLIAICWAKGEKPRWRWGKD